MASELAVMPPVPAAVEMRIRALNVYVMCSDGQVREVALNEKQRMKVLGFITFNCHGGRLQLHAEPIANEKPIEATEVAP